MKTQNEILTDWYKIVKASPIDSLNGEIRKKDRKTDSDLEDCVISIISGTNAKFLQNGTLIIKIFYKDLEENNTYSEDNLNGQVKEKLLQHLSETLIYNSDYVFDIQSRETYTERIEDDEIHQHYAVLRMNFKILIK